MKVARNRGGLGGRVSSAECHHNVDALAAETVVTEPQGPPRSSSWGCAASSRAASGRGPCHRRDAAGADRALACAAGALLLERLATGTGDSPRRLVDVGALAGRRELRDDDLVNQRDVRLDVEDFAGSSTEPDFFPSASRMSTMRVESAMTRLPSLRCGLRRGHACAPGTAPLTSSRPFSGRPRAP